MDPMKRPSFLVPQWVCEHVTAGTDVPLPPNGMSVQQLLTDLETLAEYHRQAKDNCRRYANRSGSDMELAKEQAALAEQHKAAAAFARKQIRRAKSWGEPR